MGNRRRSAKIGFTLLDLGVFVAAAALLPRAGSWSASNPLSEFITSRDRWDIAWALLVAAVVLSVGAYHLLESLEAFGEKEPPIPSDDEVKLMRYLAERKIEKAVASDEKAPPL